MGQRGRERAVKEFDTARQVPRLEDVFLEAARQAAGSK